MHNLELHPFKEESYRKGLSVDHIDRNKYNNSLYNLCWATRTQQNINRDVTSVITYKDVQYYLFDFCSMYEYSEYLYSYLAQNKVSSITERDLETLLRKVNILQKYDCQQPKIASERYKGSLLISGAIGYNICIGTLESRRDEGMSWEECVKTLLARIRRITINGEVRRVKRLV